jgi:hypothetical protein
MAWYQLFRYYYQIEQNKSLRYFILFSTLAALIKITYLIPIIALVIILLLHKKLPFSPFPNQRKLLWATTIPFICVFAWYYYARILTDITYNIHFLQQINPPLSFAEFWENTRYALNTWIDSVYPRQFVILLELVWFYTLQRKFKQLRLSGAISILLFGGFLAIFILFNRQFRYHDYYFISAIPALMFQMLYLYEEHLAQRQLFSGLVGILTLIGLFISPFIHANHTQKQVKATYTPGDYYCQNLINNTEDFNKAKAFIDRELGPGEIIVAFDPSPNTMLYYLQRQGIRLAPDFEEILSIGIIQSKLDENILAKPYICVNNYFDLPKEHYIQDIIEVKPIFQTGDLWIFKLRKDRFNF